MRVHDITYYVQWYKMLEAYYQGNEVYEALESLQITDSERLAGIKALRNPARRVVEFYALKLFYGSSLEQSLPLEGRPETIAAIYQLWRNSNWQSLYPLFVRNFVLYGDTFIKVNVLDGNISLQLILPEHVTNFALDDAGNVTTIRLDILTSTVDNWTGNVTYTYHVEMWDKASNRYDIWDLERGTELNTNVLPLVAFGTPTLSGAISDLYNGKVIVPFVYGKLFADNAGRGGGIFAPYLTQIDEFNRKATELAEKLFRHNRPALQLTASSLDSSGRPMPAPTLGDGDTITISGETFYRLPSGWTISNVAPEIDFTSQLAALENDANALIYDLPELVWSSIVDKGSLSGRAISFLFDVLKTKTRTVRGQLQDVLIRTNTLALEIATTINLINLSDFTHTFQSVDLLANDKSEQANIISTLVSAGATLEAAAKFAGANLDTTLDTRVLSPLE